MLEKVNIIYFDDTENTICEPCGMNPHILVLGRVGRGKKFRTNSIQVVRRENWTVDLLDKNELIVLYLSFGIVFYSGKGSKVHFERWNITYQIIIKTYNVGLFLFWKTS